MAKYKKVYIPGKKYVVENKDGSRTTKRMPGKWIKEEIKEIKKPKVITGGFTIGMPSKKTSSSSKSSDNGITRDSSGNIQPVFSTAPKPKTTTTSKSSGSGGSSGTIVLTPKIVDKNTGKVIQESKRISSGVSNLGKSQNVLDLRNIKTVHTDTKKGIQKTTITNPSTAKLQMNKYRADVRSSLGKVSNILTDRDIDRITMGLNTKSKLTQFDKIRLDKKLSVFQKEDKLRQLAGLSKGFIKKKSSKDFLNYVSLKKKEKLEKDEFKKQMINFLGPIAKGFTDSNLTRINNLFNRQSTMGVKTIIGEIDKIKINPKLNKLQKETEIRKVLGLDTPKIISGSKFYKPRKSEFVEYFKKPIIPNISVTKQNQLINMLNTGQSMTLKQQADVFAVLKKSDIKLTNNQKELFKKFVSATPVGNGYNLTQRSKAGEKNPFWNDFKEVIREIKAGSYDMGYDIGAGFYKYGVVSAYNYGKRFTKEAFKGNFVLDDDIKKVVKWYIKGLDKSVDVIADTTKFVKKNPVLTSIIVSTVAFKLGKSLVRKFIKDPVETFIYALDIYGGEPIVAYKFLKSKYSPFVIKNVKILDTFAERGIAQNLQKLEGKTIDLFHSTTADLNKLFKSSTPINEKQLKFLINDMKKNPEIYINNNLKIKSLKEITKSKPKKIIINTIKNLDDVILHGSGALKLQLRKFRKIGDLDIIAKNPQKIADKIVNELNNTLIGKLIPNRYKAIKNWNGVLQIFDTLNPKYKFLKLKQNSIIKKIKKIKDKDKISNLKKELLRTEERLKNYIVIDIADLKPFEKEFGKLKPIKINGLNVVDVKQSLAIKLKISQTPDFIYRRAKELKDIELIIGKKILKSKINDIDKIFTKNNLLKIEGITAGSGTSRRFDWSQAYLGNLNLPFHKNVKIENKIINRLKNEWGMTDIEIANKVKQYTPSEMYFAPNSIYTTYMLSGGNQGIIMAKNIKIESYGKKIQKLLKRNYFNLLSPKERGNLFILLREWRRKNPNKAFVGQKALADKFGEFEILVSEFSKFYPRKTLIKREIYIPILNKFVKVQETYLGKLPKTKLRKLYDNFKSKLKKGYSISDMGNDILSYAKKNKLSIKKRLTKKGRAEIDLSKLELIKKNLNLDYDVNKLKKKLGSIKLTSKNKKVINEINDIKKERRKVLNNLKKNKIDYKKNLKKFSLVDKKKIEIYFKILDKKIKELNKKLIDIKYDNKDELGVIIKKQKLKIKIETNIKQKEKLISKEKKFLEYERKRIKNDKSLTTVERKVQLKKITPERLKKINITKLKLILRNIKTKAPTRATPTRKAPTRTTPTRKAPTRKAPTRKAPTRKAPTRTTPVRTTPTRKAPTRTTPTIKAPTRTTPIRTTPTRTTPIRTTPVITTPVRTTPRTIKQSTIRKIKIPKLPNFFIKNKIKKKNNQVLVFEINFRERRNISKKYNPKTNPVIKKVLKLQTTKNRALNKVMNLADNKTIRSIEIKPIKLINKKIKDVKLQDTIQKFRLKKSKSTPVLKFVEKSKYAIDKKGEKLGLKRKKRIK